MGLERGLEVGERNGGRWRGGGSSKPRREPRASKRWWKGEGWAEGEGGGKRGGLKGSLAEILGKSSVKSHQNIPLAKTTTYSYHHCPLGIGGIRLRKILILPLPPPLSPFQKSPFSRLLLNFFFSLSSSISRETTVRHDKISFQISKFRKTDRSKKKKKLSIHRFLISLQLSPLLG